MNIRLSISKQSYKTKPKPVQISKMVFEESTINLPIFAELIRNGYSYTHIYNTSASTFTTSEKTIKNFKETSIISIDVDNANKSLYDFVGSLTYIPTIAYTTPSNNNETKEYRFRLVYVFESPITDCKQFEAIYNVLESQLNKDNDLINKDKCGSNVAQYMNGSYGCEMINSFDKIHNINNFNICANQNNNNKNNSLYINLKCTNDTTTKLLKNTKLSKKFINDLNTLEPFKFIQKYKSVYPIFERTEINFNDGYALLNEDYIQINRKWTWGSIETTNGLSKLYTITQKIKDGQGRRYHIGLAAMIRRKINPNVTLEHLIVNAVYDRLYYYDNSDNVLTNQVLIERCSYVMNLKEITIKSYNKKKFMIDKKYWSEKGINANQAKNIVRKQLNYESIGSWYNCLKSVKENLIWANDNKIKVSRRTLYNFCKDNMIDTNPNKGVSKEVGKIVPNDVTKCNTTIDNEKCAIKINNEINNIDYNNTNTTNNMRENDFMEKIDIMIYKLSNIDDLDLLNINYNKALEWVNRMFIKYDFNLDKESIISEITSIYKKQMSNLSTNNKGELLYRIQVANYNSNDLYDLIKLLQQKIKTDFYINDLLISYNDDGYPWELIANKQIEYAVTAV